MFEGENFFIITFIIAAPIFILGLIKLAEVIIWMFANVNIQVGA